MLQVYFLWFMLLFQTEMKVRMSENQGLDLSLQSQRDSGRVGATEDEVTVMNQARRATDNVLQVKIQIQTKPRVKCI